MIILDIDDGSTNEIIAFEGDNTKELTTIALVKDNNRIDLTGKTITLGYTDVNSQGVGDIIENITISNAKQGEITLPIDSKITKKDGFYNCAFKITEGDYIKFTAPFRLWIKANLFTSISKAIINTDTFNSIKEILSNADKLKQDLSNAETTLSSLDSSNLAAKENIKSLIDNNTKADSINKTLVNSNNLAKKNIANLDTANNKATENISTLDSKNKAAGQTVKDLATQNNTATDNIAVLETNFNNAKSINTDLVNNNAKATELNKTLTANVASVDSKNKVLQDSIKQAEDFAKTLTGGTDFVQMRKDIDTLENGLKNNQMLSYNGSDITCKNSLEGRTTGLKLYGKTLYKRKDGTYTDVFEEGCTLESCGEAEGNKISILTHGRNLFDDTKAINKKLNEIIKIDITGFKQYKNLKEGKYFSQIEFTDGSKVNDGNLIIYSFNNNNDVVKAFMPNTIKELTIEDSKKIAYLKLLWNSQAVEKYGDKIIKNVSLIQSNIITDGEPYKEYKKEIQLQQPFAGLESVQDTIEETDKGVVYTQNIRKIVLNGTEDWIRRNMGLENETIGFGILNTEINNYKIDGEGKCDKFIFEKNNNALWNIDKEGFHCADFLQLRINKNKLETLDIEGFKKWLQANPVTLYYQLAEPIKTILKGIEETDVDTYNSITYVKSLNSIPATIDFSICTNYGSLLMQHSQEINKIWDTINKLLVPALIDVNKNIAMSTIKNNL